MEQTSASIRCNTWVDEFSSCPLVPSQGRHEKSSNTSVGKLGRDFNEDNRSIEIDLGQVCVG